MVEQQPRRGGRQAAAIALTYAVVATVWILASGWLLDLQIADPALRSAFEYGKGLFFVAITTLLLWLLVRRALRRERAIAAEREAAIARLAETERVAAVGLLASGLAHEFNNLHAVVDGHLELAQHAGPGDPRLDRRLAGARAALGRATGLTRSLLAVARPGNGQRQPVRLDLLAAETMELLRRGMEADGVAVSLELGEVPALLGDPHQLGQVLMNLYINADHAMHGAPERRLRVRTACARDMITVEVADTGSGIAPEHLARLFQPFFTTKLSGTAHRPRGSGLGLSVSKAMVEAHGGSLRVDSRLGAGSTFVINLPIPAHEMLNRDYSGHQMDK